MRRIIISEQQCTRTDRGWIVEASDLRWEPGDWPSCVTFLPLGKAAVRLSSYWEEMAPDGSVRSATYTDGAGVRLEVLNG